MRGNRVSWMATALVLAAMGRAASAQDAQTPPPAPSTASDSLEEIVVTAQQRQERLQDVPIAVTAYSADKLEVGGITSTTELSNITPGLSIRSTYNQLEPHLRGVGTTAAGPGTENPVALYVDDVYYASQVATALALNDIEQVAVLKGPQGTLFGRNATGGVIQVTTKDPTQQGEGTISETIGNYLTTTTDAYLAGGLADNLAGSLTARYSAQGDGWGQNINTGADIHKVIRDIGLRSKLVFTPSDTLTIKLGVDYADRRDSMGPNFRPASGTSPLPTLPGYRPTDNIWDVDSETDNANRFRGGGVSLNVNDDLGFAHLIEIAGYRADSLQTHFSPTATPSLGQEIFIAEKTDQFTEELRLVSPPSEQFTWVSGLFFFYGHGKDDPLQLSLYPAITGAPFPIQADLITNETTKSAAGYAQATARVVENTHLTAGLRYTWENRTFDGSEEDYGPGFLLAYIPSTLPPEENYYRTTWRLALDHQFTDDLMGYISYNRGFKSGGYNTHFPANPPYAPELLDAYEIGAKSEWLDHRLRINAAGFFYSYNNVQVAKYRQTSLIYNGAGAEIYGLDLDFEAKPTSNFQVSGGIEWLRNYYTSFPGADFASALPGGGVALTTGNAAGKRLPNAPNFTADLSADYFVELTRGVLDFNVTNSYSSDFYQEADNFLKQPAYDILNSSMTWTAPDGRLSVKLWANNLLDAAVATQLSTVAPFIANVDYANPPRTYGATVRYSF